MFTVFATVHRIEAKYKERIKRMNDQFEALQIKVSQQEFMPSERTERILKVQRMVNKLQLETVTKFKELKPPLYKRFFYRLVGRSAYDAPDFVKKAEAHRTRLLEMYQIKLTALFKDLVLEYESLLAARSNFVEKGVITSLTQDKRAKLAGQYKIDLEKMPFRKFNFRNHNEATQISLAIKKQQKQDKLTETAVINRRTRFAEWFTDLFYGKKALIDEKRKQSLKDAEDNLLYLYRVGDITTVKHLLASKKNPDEQAALANRSFNKAYLLHEACKRGDIRLARLLLLTYKANPSVQDKDGLTASEYARSANCHEAIFSIR